METVSALLALCVGNSPVTGYGTQSFDVFFDLRLNKRFSKQSWCWWFKTPSHSLWRHRNDKNAHGQQDAKKLVKILAERILAADISHMTTLPYTQTLSLHTDYYVPG